MKYIVIDLEWNQPLRTEDMIRAPFPFDSEIIEIGAIRLSEEHVMEDSFKCFIRPQLYPVMNGDVASLTKIRMQDLEKAPGFAEAWALFSDWCGEEPCFCTWGGSDVPVLMDNMLMHGIRIPALFRCCDLQEIFGYEIMRDGRRWSLENAIDTLGLTKDRAHDALNDVRNTFRICERVDLFSYADEYVTAYVNYEADRLDELVAGKRYESRAALLDDETMCAVTCPYCGERVALGGWVLDPRGPYWSSGRCGEGDEFLARYRHRRAGEASNLIVSRTVLEMTDPLWDQYQDALDQAEAALAAAARI